MSSTPETILSASDQLMYERFEVAYDLTYSWMERLGCQGPAIEAFKLGSSNDRWMVEGGDRGKTIIPLSKEIKPGSKDSEVKIDRGDLGVISSVMLGAFAIKEIEIEPNSVYDIVAPYMIIPGIVSAFPFELTGLGAPTMEDKGDTYIEFFEGIIDDHPEEVSDYRQVFQGISSLYLIRKRFTSGFAAIILANEIKKRFGDEGFPALAAFLDRLQPQFPGYPLNPEIIEERIKAKSLEYNKMAYELSPAE